MAPGRDSPPGPGYSEDTVSTLVLDLSILFILYGGHIVNVRFSETSGQFLHSGHYNSISYL